VACLPYANPFRHAIINPAGRFEALTEMSITMLFDIASALIALGLLALWLVLTPAKDEV
jgi:hypothetical protein